jgi:HEPN domain-containing protein
MNRLGLQELARIRLAEARTLLENGHAPGAYYLCGYAVECALKACIARQTREHDFPDKKLANAAHTHKLAELVKLAGLEPELDREIRTSPDFSDNWTVVKDWSEESRYTIKGDKETRDLLAAITNRTYGVLPWIRRHW